MSTPAFTLLYEKFLTLWSITAKGRIRGQVSHHMRRRYAGDRVLSVVSDYKSTQKIQTLKEIGQ